VAGEEAAVELSREELNLSELIGTPVRDNGGRRIGRVYEVRARWRGEEVVVEAVLVGRSGLLRRLRGSGEEPRGFAWEEIVERSAEGITVGSGDAATRSPRRRPGQSG
jgi:sporulation protein YlmC with PRC-barrel domain